MGTLFSLAILSGLSLNLLFQFSLDLFYMLDKKQHSTVFLAVESLFLFAAVTLVWLIFSVFFNPLAAGYLETVVIMPLSVLVYGGLEKILFIVFPAFREKKDSTALPAYSGFAFAASYLTLRLASSLADALVLAAGFSLGILGALFIVKEIDKRSKLEAVPRFLKGSPILLISLGLLSIITSSAAAVFLTALGVF